MPRAPFSNMPLSVMLATGSFTLMLLGYKLSHRRILHIPIMLLVVALDVAMPFYLYQTGDWVKRLIDQEEILSFLMWMHFGLIVSLYVLLAAQIYTAIGILQGKVDSRIAHRQQGQAALFVKGLVVVTGAMLVK